MTMIINPSHSTVLGSAGSPMFTKELMLEIAKGNIAGHTSFHVFGERANVTIDVDGEDLWHGTAPKIPTPPAIGEQVTIVSDGPQDNITGTGIQQIEMHYLDGAGYAQEETMDMNAEGGVNSIATDVTFINALYGVGGNPLAAADGRIEVHRFGAPLVVYDVIIPGTNFALTCQFKVPQGSRLFMGAWHGSASGAGGTAKPQSIRLRSTSTDEGLLVPIFLFKGSERVETTPFNLPLKAYIPVPAGAVVKMTAWVDGNGGTSAGGFDGVLVEDGY